jgi:peptidoglycan/xylan/chitin deacetylase (PgdA/CDA1 family)
MSEHSFCWPNGKRIAVYLNAMVEVWSPGKAPTYTVQTTGLNRKNVDYGGVSWSRYGGNVGVWRVLKVLDSFGVKGTFCANAKSAEEYPAAFEQIIKSGHEVAAHGVWQDQVLPDMTPAEQQQNIHESLASFERLTGVRPVGWKSPVLAWTPETLEFLTQEGLRWFGDFKDSDLPRRIHTLSGSIIAIPASEFTDNRVLRGSPKDYFDLYKNTFDYLYNHERGSILNLSVHCHWGGRAPIMAMVHQLYEYFTGFDDVWFPTLAEIADYMNTLSFDELWYAERHFGVSPDRARPQSAYY